MSFIAFRIQRQGEGVKAGFQELELDDLSPGAVVVRVLYSSINYKDALAATGRGKILRVPAVNGGIDLAGVVVSSHSDQFSPGDRVMACGAGLSESIDGGYSEFARLDAQSLIPIPNSLSDHDAMAIGTAGFTAALALIRMELNGQKPDLGPIVVTGATGGVGSFAIDFFSNKKYEVLAMTGKREAWTYLESVGAKGCLDRPVINSVPRALEKAQWGGAVDNVGGETLSWLTRTVGYFGNIACIGLAAGASLETSVMPFILRSVSLLGINSSIPKQLRDEVWGRLNADLRPSHLEKIANRTIVFEDLPSAFDAYIDGTIIGRTVVKISD